MRFLICFLAIANLGQAPAVKGGTVTGSVDAYVKAKPVKVEEIYVYLQGDAKPTSAIGANYVAKIEQRNEKYSPFVTVLPLGGRVFFPNRDSIEHNVWAPAVKKNGFDGFDLGRYNTDKTGRHRDFRQIGEFDIYCDIHKCMWAKVKVVPTRHFVKVVDGKYSFADVPPGAYQVVAWAPGSTEVKSQRFEVAANGTVNVESLNLQYEKKSNSHNRIDGSAYSSYAGCN